MGCRRRAAQDDLIRLVRSADGSIAAGRSLPGRGAWLCRGSRECFDLAQRKRSFARAFRSGVDVASLERVADGCFGPSSA